MKLSNLLWSWFEWPRCCWIGLIIRVILLGIGSLQDSFSQVKYTDIDYSVYSDAAVTMSNGDSPYQRATYRYTPLLSGLLIPVVWLPVFGKLIFIMSDLLLSWLIRRVMLLRGMSEQRATTYGALPILLNPLIINLSTRGNADILIVVLVMGMLDALFRRRIRLAAFLYGLAVHVKIYPIIYAPAIILFLNADYPKNEQTTVMKGASSKTKSTSQVSNSTTSATTDAPVTEHTFIQDLTSSLGLKLTFFLVSASTFVILTWACYLVYGYEFLFETYLYHITRMDTRHNFSPYFYQLYLEASAKYLSGVSGTTVITTSFEQVLPLLSFLPQLLVLLLFSLSLYRDLPLCLFAQTMVFVTFNKVITAQYFLWWLVLLVLIAPQSRLNWRGGVILGMIWMGSELNWLQWGYQLEFIGLPVFFSMWFAGLTFFIANSILIGVIIWKHSFRPVLQNGACTQMWYDDMKKD